MKENFSGLVRSLPKDWEICDGDLVVQNFDSVFSLKTVVLEVTDMVISAVAELLAAVDAGVAVSGKIVVAQVLVVAAEGKENEYD